MNLHDVFTTSTLERHIVKNENHCNTVVNGPNEGLNYATNNTADSHGCFVITCIKNTGERRILPYQWSSENGLFQGHLRPLI